MLYVFVEPLQTVEAPEMLPGEPGTGVTVTESVFGADVPQPLFALIVISPLVELAVALILLVKLEPVQPEGKTQV
jgi:hypothetical protein